MDAEQKRKHREYAREWRERNPEKVREANRRYNATRVPKPLTEEQKRRKRRKRRESNLRDKYGLTLKQYDQFMHEQVGLCAICQQPFGDKRPHVDHDHETGAVRGLLCHGCNTSLGGFQDSAAVLLRAVIYLRRSQR